LILREVNCQYRNVGIRDLAYNTKCQNSCEDQIDENLGYLCRGGNPPVEPLSGFRHQMSFPGNVSTGQSNTTQKQAGRQLVRRQEIDPESRIHRQHDAGLGKPKSLGAGVSTPTDLNDAFIWQRQTALAIGAFGTTLTTLSLSLMEWRDITMTNVYVANFFFVAAFGLVTIAQWELAIGNGFAYTVFSAFGKNLTRSSSEKLLPDRWKRALLCRLRCSSYTVAGIVQAYGRNTTTTLLDSL
jgi:hypothetical protein